MSLVLKKPKYSANNKSSIKISFPSIMPKVSLDLENDGDYKDSRNQLKPLKQLKLGSWQKISASVYSKDLVNEQSLSPKSKKNKTIVDIWSHALEPRV